MRAENVLELGRGVATFSLPFRSPKLPCARFGGELAQLVERDNGIVEVMGSTPLLSTSFLRRVVADAVTAPYQATVQFPRVPS